MLSNIRKEHLRDLMFGNRYNLEQGRNICTGTLDALMCLFPVVANEEGHVTNDELWFGSNSKFQPQSVKVRSLKCCFLTTERLRCILCLTTLLLFCLTN